MSVTKAEKYIEDNINLLDDEKNGLKAFLAHCPTSLFQEVLTILNESDVDTLAVQQSLFVDDFMSQFKAYKRFGDVMSDGNSWSRFQYILADTNMYGLTDKQCVEYFIQNKKQLGVEMTPLEHVYAYIVPDYDLGYLDKEKYKQAYIEDFED